MLQRLFHFSTLTLCIVLTLAACHNNVPPESAPAPIEPMVQGNQLRYPAGHPQLALLGIKTAAPSKTLIVELPAKLVWNEEHTQRIYPAFAGRVVSIKADLGQSVQSGALLAQFASPDFGSAQADVLKAQADGQFSQKNLQRQKELFDAGVIARKDYEQAQADSLRTQAEAARAQARTKLYGNSTGVDQQFGVRATLAGVVVERNLNPGQEVRADQFGPGVPAMFVVSDPTRLWVQIDARESEIRTLKIGSIFELTVASLPGEKFEGKVTAVADAIDPSTRTIKVRGSLSNPQRLLKAEMLATAKIERTMSSGVVVPTTAVALRGTQYWAFVQVQPGVFESRDVTLGYEGPNEVIVSHGLEVGEQVVSDNMLILARAFRIAQDAAPAASAPMSTSSAASIAVNPEKSQGNKK